MEQAPLGQTYFSVREQSLQGKVISGIIELMYPHFQFHKIFILFIAGDCETAYTIHEVPQYEAMEIEDRLQREEKYRSEREHLPGGLSQVTPVCQGTKFISQLQLFTHNFT